MNYAECLAAATQNAHAARELNAPTVISTFAGGGGSTTGYHMAGYDELLAVEWDDHACETLRLNYPNLQIWQGDIANLSVHEVLERTNLKAGQLDLLDGSPPCQGFSISGKRILNDPRNQLFREFTRLLTGLQPRVFVMENVSGLVKGKMKTIFLEILAELKNCGYQITVSVVNASYLGVPQNRERVIFIGVRNDLDIKPSSLKPQTKQTTAKQALEDLLNAPDDLNVIKKIEWLNVWTRVKAGNNFATVHPNGSLFSAVKLHPDRPSPTVTKTVRSVGATLGGGLYHWAYPRLLSISELCRISSFPDTYKFPGNVRTDKKAHVQAWARIGNAVPPLMARAIGLHIRETILKK